MAISMAIINDKSRINLSLYVLANEISVLPLVLIAEKFILKLYYLIKNDYVVWLCWKKEYCLNSITWFFVTEIMSVPALKKIQCI